MKNKVSKWHQRYMGLAHHVKTWSEDPNKQVGAVIVKNNRVLSIGYNGFPTGVGCTHDRLCSEEKLDFMVHAETNSIYTAAQMGHNLSGATLYSTFYPCPACTRAIIQSGIKHIITLPINQTSKWAKKAKISKQMIDESGIQLTIL